MYTRIALGKNSAMDVVSGESSGGQGQLLILYPLLFALQILEMYIGELCSVGEQTCTGFRLKGHLGMRVSVTLLET